MKLPFKKYIITQLLRGKTCSTIAEQLSTFGYNVKVDEITEMIQDIQKILPDNIQELFSNSEPLDSSNQEHMEWMKYYDVYDFIKYLDDIMNKKNQIHMKDTFDNMIWIHNHPAVASLTNILIFNNEPHNSIATILEFKFQKKIPVQTITYHKKIMWDTSDCSALEALHFFRHFNNTALAITSYESGCTNEEQPWAARGGQVSNSENTNGFSNAIIFQDTDYIKWKIGYKEIKKPNVSDFLEEVKLDSFYKYKEAMQMIQNIERTKSEGTVPGGEQGSVHIDNTTTRFRNVEEQKHKLAKAWLDMYIKANKSIPESTNDDEINEFFNMLKQQVELEFEENDNSEYLTTIDQAQDMLKDINGEKNDFSYEKNEENKNEENKNEESEGE